jgi:predicted transcriptional regulator
VYMMPRHLNFLNSVVIYSPHGIIYISRYNKIKF